MLQVTEAATARCCLKGGQQEKKNVYWGGNVQRSICIKCCKGSNGVRCLVGLFYYCIDNSLTLKDGVVDEPRCVARLEEIALLNGVAIEEIWCSRSCWYKKYKSK